MAYLLPSGHLFVAREEELARMHGFIDQALDGRGSVCFVTGDAGAGKSSLLEEFERRVQIEYPNLIFAFGDCNPQTGTGDAYLPFREIMSALTGAEESGIEQPKDTGRSRCSPSNWCNTSKNAANYCKTRKVSGRSARTCAGMVCPPASKV